MEAVSKIYLKIKVLLATKILLETMVFQPFWS